MPFSKIKTRWTDGNLEFMDDSGGIIATWDSDNRKLTFASGANLDLSAATGLVTFAAGEIAAADLATNAVTTTKINALAVTGAKIAALAVTGAQVAEDTLAGNKAAVVANANTGPGLPVLHRVNTAGGATADTDVTVDDKVLVLDVWVQNNGAGTASDTITVKNGSSAITDAIDISGADKTIKRVATIDNANATIAAGGTLKVTETDGGSNDSPATTVYVLCVKVA